MTKFCEVTNNSYCFLLQTVVFSSSQVRQYGGEQNRKEVNI